MTDHHWRIAWFALAVALVLVLWGWSDNGRWQWGPNWRFVIDTKTGKVYHMGDRIVETAEPAQKSP